MGWDWKGLDGMGLDGIGWDGIGWDGLGLDGLGWGWLGKVSELTRTLTLRHSPAHRGLAQNKALVQLSDSAHGFLHANVGSHSLLKPPCLAQGTASWSNFLTRPMGPYIPMSDRILS